MVGILVIMLLSVILLVLGFRFFIIEVVQRKGLGLNCEFYLEKNYLFIMHSLYCII